MQAPASHAYRQLPGLCFRAVSAALQFTRSELLACVEAHADSILSVHQDTGVHAYDSVTTTDGGPLDGAQPTADTSNSTIIPTGESSGVETGAPWALDRLDQTSLPLDSLYHYYSTGSDVNIYIIDTVRLTSALPPLPGWFTRETNTLEAASVALTGGVSAVRF